MTIRQNNDSEKAKEIRQAIKENGGYCCCSIEKTEDTKCLCKEFREKTTPGYCSCGLYYKE